MPNNDQPEYRPEQVPVRAHERDGKPVRASLSTRLKRIFRIGRGQQDGLRNGVTSIAADESSKPIETVPNVYRPEMFREDVDLAYDGYRKDSSYTRFQTKEGIAAAAALPMNLHHRGMAQTLCGTDDLSPEQVERYWHTRDELSNKFRETGMSPETANARADDILGVYVRQGLNIKDAELLARCGVLGEPPELSPSERERWDDKWQAFRDKRRAYTLSDVSYVERPGMVGTPIEDMEFAVVDFETTGLEPVGGERLIEIGVTVMNGRGEVLERFETLVNPEESIDRVNEWTKVHQLTDGDVRDAPTFAEVYPEFARVMNGRVFVAQNKHFEESYISDEMARMGLEAPPVPSLCTMEMARQFVVKDKIGKYSLGAQAEGFGVALGDRAHTAIGDTDATATILKAHLDNLRAKGVTHLYTEGPLATMPGAGSGPVPTKVRGS